MLIQLWRKINWQNIGDVLKYVFLKKLCLQHVKYFVLFLHVLFEHAYWLLPLFYLVKGFNLNQIVCSASNFKINDCFSAEKAL